MTEPEQISGMHGFIAEGRYIRNTPMTDLLLWSVGQASRI